jgi:hypothetical protein
VTVFPFCLYVSVIIFFFIKGGAGVNWQLIKELYNIEGPISTPEQIMMVWCLKDAGWDGQGEVPKAAYLNMWGRSCMLDPDITPKELERGIKLIEES